MKILIFILLSFLEENIAQEYQLLIHQFFFGEALFNINLINPKNKNKDNLYYYGFIENIENLFNDKNFNYINTEKIKDNMKEKAESLIYILNGEFIHYINFFPKSTKFLVLDDLVSYLENVNENYNIFSIIEDKKLFMSKVKNLKKYYYIKIGAKIDHMFLNFMLILLFFSIFICSVLSFIMTKMIRTIDEYYQLAIYYLMCICSYLLIVSNIINGIFFIFFKNQEYCFIVEYATLLIYSFYKSNIFAVIILISLGWGTIYFRFGRKFKILNKIIFMIDLLLSFFIPISVFFLFNTHKLNLFYIKNNFEYLVILSINVFSLFKRLIPLLYQLKYEKRIRSNLNIIYEYKFNKLFLINIIIFFYSIFFILTTFLDYNYIFLYVNSYNIHFIFQLFYESIFIIFFLVSFFPKKLPDCYYDDVVFKYKSQIVLKANIYEEENDNINIINEINDNDYSTNLNISNLTLDILKNFSKKKKYPIVFINPSISTKNKKLFKEIHLGIVEKNT